MSSRISDIIDSLSELYPYARAELNFTNPFETLIATILSAQCTDKRVNLVTESLFKECHTAREMAALNYSELEEKIKACGLYKMKARHIIDACQYLVENYGGEVPHTREELMRLPGVGQKTAGVVLMAAFGADEIPVDTHVFRLSHRLGLSQNSTPEGVEADLRQLIPEGERGHVHHLLIWHGRRCCTARKPNCAGCPLGKGLCMYNGEDK